jgi:hypothetical protein
VKGLITKNDFYVAVWVALCLCVGCHATAQAQPCHTTNYGHSAYRAPSRLSYHHQSYSYAAPTYHAPAKEYKQDYKHEDYVFLLTIPVFKLRGYGATYVEPPPAAQGQPAPQAQPQQAPQPQAAPQSSQMQQILSQNEQILKALKALGEKVDKVEQRVEVIERRRAPAAQPPPKQDEPKEEARDRKDGDQTAQLISAFKESSAKSCAMCHSRSNAKKYGNDFVYTEDDNTIRADMTADEREEVERQITSQIKEGKQHAPRMPRLTGARAEATKPAPLTNETGGVHLAMMDLSKRNAKKK